MVRPTVAPPRRHVFKWHMRQHQMNEVQLSRLTVNRRQELTKRAVPTLPDFPGHLPRTTEIGPVFRHRRQLLSEGLCRTMWSQTIPSKYQGQTVSAQPSCSDSSRRTELWNAGKRRCRNGVRGGEEIDGVYSNVGRRRASLDIFGQYLAPRDRSWMQRYWHAKPRRASRKRGNIGYRSHRALLPSSRLFSGSSSNTTTRWRSSIDALDRHR